MVDFLLLETGDFILLETGDFVLLEIQSIPSQFRRIIIMQSESNFIIKSRNKLPFILTTSDRLTIRRKI